MSPHSCSARDLVLGAGEIGVLNNFQRFPSLRGQKYLVFLVLFDTFLSCGFSFGSVAHPGPSRFLLYVFCLFPVIQFFDTARVDRTRSWLYAACSVSYLGAMVSSNSALQFVNYPTQVKPQGVMRVGSEVV